MYHYYGTALKNYNEYLLNDMVKYKKYFYVLRPIFACKWIEKKKCPPPVLFQELADEVLEDSMKETIQKLVEIKMTMNEFEKGPKIQKVNDYICENLQYYKKCVEEIEDDRVSDWETLNRIFFNIARNQMK